MNMDRIIRKLARILMRQAMKGAAAPRDPDADGAGAPAGSGPRLTAQQRQARRAVRMARRAARATKG